MRLHSTCRIGWLSEALYNCPHLNWTLQSTCCSKCDSHCLQCLQVTPRQRRRLSWTPSWTWVAICCLTISSRQLFNLWVSVSSYSAMMGNYFSWPVQHSDTISLDIKELTTRTSQCLARFYKLFYDWILVISGWNCIWPGERGKSINLQVRSRTKTYLIVKFFSW